MSFKSDICWRFSERSLSLAKTMYLFILYDTATLKNLGDIGSIAFSNSGSKGISFLQMVCFSMLNFEILILFLEVLRYVFVSSLCLDFSKRMLSDTMIPHSFFVVSSIAIAFFSSYSSRERASYSDQIIK